MVRNRINHACVITPTYPDMRFIERGAFVEYLVRIWIEHGMNVDVIAPRSIPNLIRSYLKGKQEDVKVAADQIFYPTYPTVSNKKLGYLDLEAASRRMFLHAALKGLKKVEVPDFYYGKFLMRGGKAAVVAKKKTNRPAFVDIGEHLLLDELSLSDISEAKKIIEALDGIACVSDELATEVIQLGADPENVFVYPNTVDLKRFYPMNQESCRAQLNLPFNVPIIIFVGHFIERKGPMRVYSSMNETKLSNLKGIFIGRGNQKPVGHNVIHAGPVPNSNLPIWLNAADLFVLPTLSEGHCNAINEAMACGLPIISSKIPEIQFQVPDDAGILVNPNQPAELTTALSILLKDSNLMKSMGAKAAEIQKERSSVDRATAVIEWIRDKVSQ